MGAAERQATARVKGDQMRRIGLRIALAFIGVAITDFILLAILAPNLVDRHEDLALAGAIGCVGLALALTIWLSLRLWRDIGHIAEARRRLRQGPHLKVIEK